MGWFYGLSEAQRGGVVYGAIFLVWLLGFEIPAALGLVPWPTTTGTIRDSIKWWHPVAALVALILFQLWGHFDRGWSVAYLIFAALLAIAACAIHAVA